MRLGQLLYALFLTALVMLGGPVLRGQEAVLLIGWRTDYAEARSESERSQKPLFIYFTADDCVHCRRLEATTLRDPRVIAAVRRCVPLRADRNLARLFNVESAPYCLVYVRGRKSAEWSGYVDAPEFVRRLAPAFQAMPPIERLPVTPQPLIPVKGETEKIDPYGRALAASPCASPCSCAECWCAHTGQTCREGTPCKPMGLDPSKLSGSPQLWFGGTPVAEGEFHGSEVPDLSKLGYGTVVSSDPAKRDKIVAEIATSGLPIARQFRWQARAPDSWDLEGWKLGQSQRFKESDLLIALQAPPEKPGGLGKVLLTDFVWEGLPALQRKIDPNFDVDRRPGPKPGPAPASEDTLPVLLAGGAVMGFFVFAGMGVLLLPSRATEETTDELQFAD